MKREKLESFIGKLVEVIFYDNSTITGILRQGFPTGFGHFLNKPKWYYIDESRIGITFRLSHVKKIKELEDG